jgi:hypothetical protein
MRRQSRKGQWWVTPLGWVLAIGLAFLAIAPGSYVTDHLSAWAAPLVWLAIAIGLLTTAAYFWSKLPGWIVLAILGFVTSFCFVVALTEGWQSQVSVAVTIGRVAIIVGSIALIIGTVVVSWRFNHRTTRALRALGEEMRSDALFSDDGERIIVHVDRSRLLRRIVLQFVFIIACGAGLYWALTASANLLVLCLGVLLGFFALFALLNIARLLMRSPTLVIGPDGLLDNATLIVTGRGLLRWDEIVAVLDYTYTSGRLNAVQHMLGIIVTDAAAVRNRQPLLNRALSFLGLGRLAGTGMLVVTQPLLDQPPDALANEIERYVRLHAPRGWRSPLIADDGEGASESAQMQ